MADARRAQQQRLSEALGGGEFVVSAEAPGGSLAELSSFAAAAVGAGARAVQVPDGALGRRDDAGMSMLDRIAALATSDAWLVPHVAARHHDPDVICERIDQLARRGAIDGTLVVTGDSARRDGCADRPDRGPDAASLLQLLAPRVSPAELVLGAALGLGEDPALDLDRAARKVQAGATVLFSQPVFDEAMLELAVEIGAALSVPVIVGVLPLRGVEHVDALERHAPGISVPAAVRAALQQRAAAAAAAWGIDHARAMLQLARSAAAGACIVPGRGGIAVVEAVVGPRPARRPAADRLPDG